MTIRRSVRFSAVLLAGVLAGPRSLAGAQQGTDTKPAATQAAGQTTGFDITKILATLNVDLRSEFDNGKWEIAVKTCDDIITRAKEQEDSPAVRDILVRAYEARGRAKLNIKDKVKEAHDDFYNLLSIDPEHELTPPVNETESYEYKQWQANTLGKVSITMNPPGTATLERENVEGKNYKLHFDLSLEPKTISLVAGTYRVTAENGTTSYETLNDTLTVGLSTGGEPIEKNLKLVRVTSTLSVVTVPAGVEVMLDDASKGATKAGAAGAAVSIGNLQQASATKVALQQAQPSAPLMINSIALGAHTLQLRLRCFRPLDVKFNVVKEGETNGNTFLADDLTPDRFKDLLADAVQKGAFQLAPTMATVRLVSAEPDAAVYLDGEKRQDRVPSDPVTLCDGPHAIEVRGAHGRFIDTRNWAPSESEVKLDVAMRQAFAIVNVPPGQALTDAQKKALAAANGGRVLIYQPREKELSADAKAPDFWSPNPTETISAEGKIIRWNKLMKETLQAQGLAALTPDPAHPTIVNLSLLAPASGVPSVVTINNEDPTSADAATRALSLPLPPFTHHAVGVSVIDADHVKGAVIVRVVDGSPAKKADLKVGSTIVRAGGAAIESAADWDAALQKAAPGGEILVDLKNPDQTGVKLTIEVAPDALEFTPGTPAFRAAPLLPANVALVELQDVISRAQATAADRQRQQAAQFNLAIIHQHLGNWKAALDALGAIDLNALAQSSITPGTIAYLKGLSLEKLGNDAEAQTQYKLAAADHAARLDTAGPLVWPLAQARIKP